MAADEHAAKFSCDRHRLDTFVAGHLEERHGLTEAICSADVHRIEEDRPAYVFTGEIYNMADAYCHDLECFLSSLSPGSVSAGKAPPRKRGRITYRCDDCGTTGTYSEMNGCREHRHAVMQEGGRPPNLAGMPDTGDGDRPGHTEYALMIMGDNDFITLRDTREIYLYRDGVYEPNGEVFIEEAAEKPGGKMRVRDAP